AGCETKIGGSGGYGWRQDVTAVGRFGVFGSGRDFRTAQKQDFPALRQRQKSAPILVTKTPFVVQGRQPVEVAIAPADRSRAGLIVAPFAGPGAGSYAEVLFVPCRDQPQTWWAGGWALRDQGQVTISVQPQNGRESDLVVGRP